MIAVPEVPLDGLVKQLEVQNRRLIEEITKLRAELDAARSEHRRLLQAATDSKLKLDDRTMAFRNSAATMREEIDYLKDKLKKARARNGDT